MEDKFTDNSQVSYRPIENNAYDPNREDLADVLQPLTDFIDLFGVPAEEYDIASKLATSPEEFELIYNRFLNVYGIGEENSFMEYFQSLIAEREERYLRFLGDNRFDKDNTQDLKKFILLREWVSEKKAQLSGMPSKAGHSSEGETREIPNYSGPIKYLEGVAIKCHYKKIRINGDNRSTIAANHGFKGQKSGYELYGVRDVVTDLEKSIADKTVKPEDVRKRIRNYEQAVEDLKIENDEKALKELEPFLSLLKDVANERRVT